MTILKCVTAFVLIFLKCVNDVDCVRICRNCTSRGVSLGDVLVSATLGVTTPSIPYKTRLTADSVRKTKHSPILGCSLSLNADFGVPSPVYIRNGKFLAPDATGHVSLYRSETVLVGCPGMKNYVVLGNSTQANTEKYDVMEASCIINATLRLGRWIGQFNKVKCDTQPRFTSEQTGRKCHQGNNLYRFGYKLKNVFYTLYEGCFDKNIYTTYYVKHELTPESKFMQNGQPRSSFTEGGMFDKLHMSSLYKYENQIKRFDELLGFNMSQRYLSKNQFLNRGHLTARADYIMHAEHRATFHYANTAPQWRRGNAGDWAALEDALRRRIHAYGRPVTVYTGTHGVFTLPDNKDRQKEIYLKLDANNNGIVPVPMYFYKIVYDQQNKAAVVFISINSSHYNKTKIEELSFCKDICEGNKNYSWLKWRFNDGTHSFCCKYQDFTRLVNYLPKLDVRKDFY